MIPFNSPVPAGNESRYLTDVLSSRHWSGNGPFTKKCQGLLEGACGATHALMTTSCTDALEMSALLVDIAPGDEVIVPSFTFVSSINAFVLRRAIPKFVDIRTDTQNIDEKKIEAAISKKTKAIVVVHYAGVACEMDAIVSLAKKHGISVIEDNAHGLFGTYRGRKLGSMGRFSTLSFHETKNFPAGEAGALLVNDPADLERAEIIQEKGTNRRRFFRGQVDKYTWMDVGSSFLPSEYSAAVLLAQLERAQEIQEFRKRICQRYQSELAGWAATNGVELMSVPAYCEQTYHMFYMLTPSLDWRTKFSAYLKDKGVGASFHYQPLHLSDMGRQLGGGDAECPNTIRAADQLIRLPLWNGLTDAQVSHVIDSVKSFKI